jgi:glycosyltransferase involved in cell wall biosynthesis
MPTPRVSVLIDTYNHEHFIDQAISSVLEQDMSLSNVEILVVDDGSTDRTREIVRRFEPRVRLLEKQNGGQASAFNFAIPQCQGDIIVFLDGDDWWTPDKLRKVVQAMTAEPEVGIVGHGYFLVFPDGRQETHVLGEGFRFRANTLDGARKLRVRGAFLGTSRMTIRASILQKILPIPETITIQADEYLSTLAGALSELRILPEPLFYYRMHDTNGYEMAVVDTKRLRRKQQSLAELARSLNQQLRVFGIAPQVIHAITGRIQSDADQLRLMADGGWPWETVNTDWSIYRITLPDAPFVHRLFKAVTLLPAMVVPPRAYFRMRGKLASNNLFSRMRKRWMPVPEMKHLRGR